MRNKLIYFCLSFQLIANQSISQNSDYWQQRVKYKIDCSVEKNQLEGKERLVYYNNSPDTLTKVYFHVYFNAFRKGSMMCDRALTIIDPERDMEKKFQNLNPQKEGKVEIKSIMQNGKTLQFEMFETIMKSHLIFALAPGDSTIFTIDFKTQIPELIRRAGMNSAEGIDYSMAQWYPKLVEYDREGYHPDVYIGREFYGVWGDYDVNIIMGKEYKLAAGCLTHDSIQIEDNKIKWHFVSKNVHDFVWAADKNYINYSYPVDSLTTFHFYFQDIGNREESWLRLGKIMAQAFKFMNLRYGRYQYSDYTFIEAGDGGMEYPLATFITGNRGLNSLVGISVHEFMHSWYQMQLATNENQFPWMDEGFTSFGAIEIMQYLNDQKLIQRTFDDFPFKESYNNYFELIKSGYFEPMNVTSDRYFTNYAYEVNAYPAGTVFLNQLEYIVGKNSFDKGLLAYFEKWKFKHPTPNDFMRIMEKNSDMELHWYKDYFIDGSYFIDYKIDTIIDKSTNYEITLERIGEIPMPLDITLIYDDNSKKYINIPTDQSFGNKKSDFFEFEIAPVWRWIDDKYVLKIPKRKSRLLELSIDESQRLADLDRSNNDWIIKYN